MTQVFNEYQITNASFVLYKPREAKFLVHNLNRARSQRVPASTFKIPHSVIALNLGIITNINDVFYKYDGQEVYLPIWTNNMNLKDAFKTSNVLAFQQIAKAIGLIRMSNEIQKMGYGNKDIGTVEDRFWLDGPLAISPIEQTEWLNKFLNNEFSSSEVVAQIKEIALKDELIDGCLLYGKTGWGQQNGWFVGWIEKNGEAWPFALHMIITDAKDLPLREEISHKILERVSAELR